MANSREGAFISPIYHLVYGSLQKHKILGAWERCHCQHSCVADHLFKIIHPSILYCGTATDKNPFDVLNYFNTLGKKAKLTTIDLSNTPLLNLDTNSTQPVQASATSLPFVDKSFDYITTDFLLSKMDLESTISTIQEWGRLIKDGGIITTTTILKTESETINSIYQIATTPFFGVHFISRDILKLIFLSSGMDAYFEKAQFDSKPLMYQYPNDSFSFIKAVPLSGKRAEEVETAKTIIHDAGFLYRTIKGCKNLQPLDLEEIVHDMINGNIFLKKTNEGEIIGFVRTLELNNQWMEVGSLYVNEQFRGTPEHFGTNLLMQALDSIHRRKKSAIAFTDSEVVKKMNEKLNGYKTNKLPSNVFLSLLKDRMRNNDAIGHIITTLHTRGIKSVYIFPLTEKELQ